MIKYYIGENELFTFGECYEIKGYNDIGIFVVSKSKQLYLVPIKDSKDFVDLEIYRMLIINQILKV